MAYISGSAKDSETSTMIEIYTGTPGSGKSLHAADEIYSFIHYGHGPVIGNFEFNARACMPRGNGGYIHLTNREMNEKVFVKFSEIYKRHLGVKRLKEGAIMLVIDECQLMFNSRDWKRNKEDGWISFFSQHRKLGYYIILIAQDLDMVDKQIRSLIEYEVMHRTVKHIGKAWILNILAGGGLHVMVRKYLPLNEKCESRFYKGNEKLFALYDSYTTFEQL